MSTRYPTNCEQAKKDREACTKLRKPPMSKMRWGVKFPDQSEFLFKTKKKRDAFVTKHCTPNDRHTLTNKHLS